MMLGREIFSVALPRGRFGLPLEFFLARRADIAALGETEKIFGFDLGECARDKIGIDGWGFRALRACGNRTDENKPGCRDDTGMKKRRKFQHRKPRLFFRAPARAFHKQGKHPIIPPRKMRQKIQNLSKYKIGRQLRMRLNSAPFSPAKNILRDKL
jgi:hypothetical protein